MIFKQYVDNKKRAEELFEQTGRWDTKEGLDLAKNE